MGGEEEAAPTSFCQRLSTPGSRGVSMKQGSKTKHAGVYRLTDGRYTVRATKQVDGRRVERRLVLPLGATLAEALAAQAGLREEPAKRAERTSLADYAVRWLEVKAARLRRSSAESLEEILRDHLLPELGGLQLEIIRREHIEAWVAKAERKRRPDGEQYAHPTVLGWWRKLRQLLGDAHASGLCPTDPTHRVPPPKRQQTGSRHELRTLSAEQLSALLGELRKVAPRRWPEVLLLASTGMRSGELYELRWDDIDAGVLHIRRSHFRGSVESTKTSAPRSIPLLPAALEALEAHRRRMLEEQHPGLASGLIFPADRLMCGTATWHRTNSSLHKPLQRAAEAAGIEQHVSPKVLRRSFNTLLLGASVDRVVLRAMMGHSSEQMTERYSGVGDEAKVTALRVLESVAPKCGTVT
jgi:integrase